ncbi:MAG TPA: YceH family protein [Microthrixaceae bacterium]|nr:YceH family protein [Microthrixaceae bacterium]
MTSAQPGELDEVAVRLLGCLVEKERTTPDDYPLTANGLMRAANQSTSRDPVVSYDAGLVESTMARMKEAGLVRFVYSQSNRSTRFRHVLDEVWAVTGEELAVLALLMLRGPQTPGELKSRSERLASFADLDAVRRVLEDLAARPEPYVRQLERVAGHKESRWMQLVGETTEPTIDAAVAFTSSGPAPGPAPSFVRSGPADAGDARIRALEAEVAALRAAIDEVRVELGLLPTTDAVSAPD